MGAAVAAIPFALPNRRVEAWKWSDLARAVEALALTPPPAAPHPTLHPILALAQFYGRNDSLSLAPGETLLRVERIDPQAGLTAKGFEALVARDAHLHRVVIQPFAADAVIALHGRIVLEAGARYTQTILAFGARFCRIETEIVHQGAGAQARLNAAYLVGDGAHVDLTSLAAHHIDHGVTRQITKGAARAGGKAVFQGKFYVARGAQKTDAQMSHDGLLLDERAEINSKPELEIYADDVACAHGNSIGALDGQALFYLRQRGMPLAAARALLIEAHIAAALEDIEDEALQESLRLEARSWLTA